MKTRSTKNSHDYFSKFIKTNSNKTVETYLNKTDDYWRTVGEKMTVDLFKQMSDRVPAYKDFLKKSQINPEKITTYQELLKVPPTDKKTYIDKYSLNELCWEGRIDTSYLLSASSGSSGTPYFWPRSTEQTNQGASISELIYKDFFQMYQHSTLYIVAFAMGTWIAGTYMMMCTEWVAQKGYPITIVTPGTNIDEILRLVKMGSNIFDQIVLVGYPPFIKDVVDTGIERNFTWDKINIKFLFSGEAFTERWRDHLQKKTKFKNILTDSLNIYGSADVGLIAHETPVSIFIRRQAAENKDILAALFKSERVPSLNQFDPILRHFSVFNHELLISARSGIPLLRYNTKDLGNIIYFGEVKKILNKNKVDIIEDFDKRKMSHLLWKVPFVYLFGRGKFSAIIYSSNIYPEHVKLVLEHPKLEKVLTGKFVIFTEETKTHEQRLDLRVEKRPEVQSSTRLSNEVEQLFVEEVSKINSEYRNNLSVLGHKVHPHVILHEYGDPQYFPRGIVKKLA